MDMSGARHLNIPFLSEIRVEVSQDLSPEVLLGSGAQLWTHICSQEGSGSFWLCLWEGAGVRAPLQGFSFVSLGGVAGRLLVRWRIHELS